MRSVALLFLVLLASTTAARSTWYISPYGSDSNSGTSAQDAFQTLATALSYAGRGDTIQAANGVYSGSANTGLTLNAVTLVGTDESSTIFTGTDNTLFTIESSTGLYYLTLTGGDKQQGLLVEEDANLTVASVTFQGFEYAVTFDTIPPDIVEIYDSTFEECSRGLQFVASHSTAPDIYRVLVDGCTFDTTITAMEFLLSGWSDDTYWELFDVTDCTFIGGGITMQTGRIPTTTITNCYFSADGGNYSPIAIQGEMPSLTVDSCEFVNSTMVAVSLSDTLAASNDCYAVISNSVFTGNIAPAFQYAVAIYSESVDLTVSGCTFTGNMGRTVATIHHGTFAAATLTVSDSVFTSNNGVPLNVTGMASTSVSGCQFTMNHAGNLTDTVHSVSGAIQLTDTVADITDSIFHQNVAYWCGAVYLVDSAVTVANSSFTSCSSSNSGGGIYSEGGDVSLTNTTMSGNSGYLGGAIAVQDCSVSLVNSTVVGNKATAAGGGIYATGAAMVSLHNSTVSGNAASSNSSMGGGIYTDTGVGLNALLCKVAGNSATIGGGWYSDSAQVNAQSVALVNNKASTAGGGFYCDGGVTSVIEVVVAENSSPSGAGYVCADGCTTFASSVYFGSEDKVVGCGTDVISEDYAVVEELAVLLGQHRTSSP